MLALASEDVQGVNIKKPFPGHKLWHQKASTSRNMDLNREEL